MFHSSDQLVLTPNDLKNDLNWPCDLFFDFSLMDWSDHDIDFSLFRFIPIHFMVFIIIYRKFLFPSTGNIKQKMPISEFLKFPVGLQFVLV